jgi:4-amino-4-deoxy-L-arabinose transferase-like glycosyltransferase
MRRSVRSALRVERSNAAEHDAMSRAGRQLLGWPAAVALILAYWAMAITGVSGKSNVFDEPLHQTGGYSYWIYGDYRIHPENGNLPQRIFALPLLWQPDHYRFPSTDSDLWRNSAQWTLARRFFFEEGNDFESMLLRGRAAAAAIGAAIAALVYCWSRRLFGPEGGALSLILAVFSPNLLAHGPLMTSDAALALLLPATLACLWTALHRATPWTVLGCGAVSGLLFVSKFSALIVAPMGLLLVALRLAAGRVLLVRWAGGWHRIETRGRQCAVIAALLVVQIALIWLVIWASYGFRYSALAASEPGRDRLMESWQSLLETPGPVAPLVATARDHRLLPEAYLYGLAFVDRHSRARFAFLNGEFGVTGWWYFFPYAFAVKTPLGLFALLVLAAAALRSGRSPGAPRAAAARASPYDAIPLFVLLAVFWTASMTAQVNVGLRHLLPVYPALFILSGAAARWLTQRRPIPSLMVIACVLWFAAASLSIRPHYLAYFNPLVGPEHGYRHLVDSSLDWGQDLPGLAAWLDADPAVRDGAPTYLAYFGSASPTHYGVEARKLPSYHDWRETADPRVHALAGGVYCVSATLLQSVYTDPPGPWTAGDEDRYWRVREKVVPLLAARATADDLVAADPELGRAYRTYDRLRFGRLRAWLRQREPDDRVGYSILIYRLSDADIRSALQGPPAELAAARVAPQR